MNIFNTDYYQFTMAIAYLITGKANETTGFESFVRHIKKEVNPARNAYIFSGEKEVISFIEKVKEEIKREDFFNRFWNIVERSINEDKKEEFYRIAKEEFKKVNKDFEFIVIPEGTIVKPYIPVFQYKGPKIFGQMIETKITNIINGKTGLKSFKKSVTENTEIQYLEDIVNEFHSKEYEDYIFKIEKRAEEYRNSTSKILLEAGYRRAPSQDIADISSTIAIRKGWNGTSNISAYQKGMVDNIGGTMAHAFVMSYETEVEAFKAWNDIFPKSTILVDTYDTINAIKTLIKNNIRPASVRIDSGDLKEMSFKVRKILDNAGWEEVKIFISGDITPKMLKEYEKEEVPFNITMAGTKYVNIDEVIHVNAGFVYKIVEYEKNGKKYYPVKKAIGKSNYPGLKKVEIKENKVIITIGSDWGFFCNPKEIKENSIVIFEGK